MKLTHKFLFAVLAIQLGLSATMAYGAGLTKPIQEDERAVLFPPARMIEMGRNVAETACADCHGVDGIGIGEGHPNLAGQRAVYLYRVLRSYQDTERENDSMLHVSQFMNDEALLAVSAYYASLSPAGKPVIPDAQDAAGNLGDNPFAGIRNEIDKCTKCHGESGNSTASGMPNLTAQNPEYFVASMAAYADGGRGHRMMEKFAGSIDAATLAEMGVYYAVQEPAQTETQGDGDLEAGRLLSENCAACHGADGNAGGEKMPTLAGQDARYFVKAMEAYKERKRQNKSMFDAVERLGDEDFINLATYYAAQEPVKRDVRMPLRTSEWIARCQRCHGLDGNSSDPRFPMLAGQDPAYLRKVMQAYTEGARSDSVMHAMSEPLSKTDVERIVAYYAAQEPRPVIYIELPCENAVDE